MSRPSSSKIEIIDIEALEVIDKPVSSSSAPFPCSVCYCDLSKLNITARQNHYDEHFPDPKPRGASPPRRRRDSNPSPTYISSSDNSTEDMRLNVKNGGSNHSALHDAFWHASMQSPPPANYTPGLILILKKALISSHEKGHTQRAVLCYERAVHIYRESWDKTWGCGYRNYMMASAALMDQPFRAEYFALLDSTLTPGVRNLQLILEEAWAKGYDEEGAEQLKKQLHGTDKWIGTAELHVAFAYQGIPSQLVDFVLSRGQGAQVVRRDTAPLLDWIKDYFSPPDQRRHTNVQDAWRGVSAVTVTDRMPFVLQHNGHSRTIVGYEIDKKGQMTLLTFDPSRQVPTAVRELALGQFEGRTRNEEGKAGGKSKTSKFMETIKHPFHGKRGHSPGSSDMGPAKRIRAGAPEVIEIGSDSEEADSSTRPMGGRVPKAEAIGNRRTSTPLSPPRGKAKESSPPGHPISPGEIIKAFRVDTTKLAAQEKYQILWFPLADPLTEQQKLAYRVVVSEKIC